MGIKETQFSIKMKGPLKEKLMDKTPCNNLNSYFGRQIRNFSAPCLEPGMEVELVGESSQVFPPSSLSTKMALKGLGSKSRTLLDKSYFRSSRDIWHPNNVSLLLPTGVTLFSYVYCLCYLKNKTKKLHN